MQMQSVSAHLPHQVGDADPLKVPHGGQAAQVSPLLQDLRQRLLPGSAPAHTPGHQALPLLVLRELLPAALAPAAAHQVWSPGCVTRDIMPPVLSHRCCDCQFCPKCRCANLFRYGLSLPHAESTPATGLINALTLGVKRLLPSCPTYR